MRNRKAFTKEEKQMQIIGVFLEEYRKGNADLTTADIAHALGVTASTKLRKLIVSLANQGALQGRAEPHAGIAGFRVLWSLHPDYIEYAKAPISQQKRGRELRINTREGSFVEVLNES